MKRVLMCAACATDSEWIRYLELQPCMDGAAECVTNGIRVRAQAWATPHGGHDGSLVFSYRVEFSHVIPQVRRVAQTLHSIAGAPAPGGRCLCPCGRRIDLQATGISTNGTRMSPRRVSLAMAPCAAGVVVVWVLRTCRWQPAKHVWGQPTHPLHPAI